MNAPLILRTTRRLSVTPLGRSYYAQCLAVAQQVEQAQALGRTNAGVGGLLCVSAPVTFGLARVAPLVPALLARHRELRIDLRLEDHLVDLVAEGVDVAIRGGVSPPDTDALVAHRLATYRRVLIASPAYFRRAGKPKAPEDLTRHELLAHLPDNRTRVTWHFERDGHSEQVAAKGAFRSNALYALRDAALGGAGIALLPEWLVAEFIGRRELALALRDWSIPSVEVVAIHRAELRGAPRVRAFIEHLRSHYEASTEPPPRQERRTERSRR